MFRTRSTDRPSQVLVSDAARFTSFEYMLTWSTGSGCVAALEAEKWLGEQEAGGDENPLERENQAEKSSSNNIVPEYRSNPLL